MNRVFEVHYAPAEIIGMPAGESRYGRRGSRKQAEKLARKVARQMAFPVEMLDIREYQTFAGGLTKRVA